MKKLFFPLMFLTASLAAMGNDHVALPVQQMSASDTALIQAANRLLNSMLANSSLRAWYDSDDRTDDEINLFHQLCFNEAALTRNVIEQVQPVYTSIFEELTQLTGFDSWSMQLTFMSAGAAAALQQQITPQLPDGSEDEYDEDDEI